jgi:hypothetical protein
VHLVQKRQLKFTHHHLESKLNSNFIQVPVSFIQLGSGFGFLNKNPVQILNIHSNQTHL